MQPNPALSSGSVSNGSTSPGATQRSQAEETTRRYSLQRRTLHIANMLASLAALGVFASSNACARLGHGVRRRVKGPTGATAAGLLMTAGVSAAVSLPFEYASGYVLERRYGLSNQNAKQWWGEYAKGSAIGLGLMLVFGSAFYALTRRSPRRWPWIASLASVPLIVALQALAPLYLFPLFNKYRRLGEGELRDRIVELARRHGVLTDEIYVFDMSKQTKKANAFVAGIGSTCRIVLADTLLDGFETDEVLFVLAHEISHYRARDAWKLAALSGVLAAFSFFAVGAACAAAAKRRPERFRTLDEPAAVPLAAFVANAVTAVALPAINAYTRSIEYAADAYAARNEPQLVSAGIRAFERLGRVNLAETDPPAWVEWVFHSHPSLRKRISRLAQTRTSAAAPDR